MRTSFEKLLQLPFAALTHVLRSMELRELINFSLQSRKAREIIKLANIKLDPFAISRLADKKGVMLKRSNDVKQDTLICYFDRKRMFDSRMLRYQLEDYGIVVEISMSKYDRPVYFHRPGNCKPDMLPYVKYLLDLFLVDTVRLAIEAKFISEVLPIVSLPVFKKCHWVELVEEAKSQEDVDQLWIAMKSVERLSVLVGFEKYITNEQISSATHFSVFWRKFLTTDRLPALWNCETVIIFETCLKALDFNRFVKQWWQSDEVYRLRVLRATFTTFTNFLEFNMVLDGIVCQVCQDYKTTEHFMRHFPEDRRGQHQPASCVTITRKDGRTACMGFTADFTMYILFDL